MQCVRPHFVVGWVFLGLTVSFHLLGKQHSHSRSDPSGATTLTLGPSIISTAPPSPPLPLSRSWETTLAAVQAATDRLLQVQKAWAYLENIFGASEDMKKHLPAESAQFDFVNQTWLTITKQIREDPNVVRATTQRIPNICQARLPTLHAESSSVSILWGCWTHKVRRTDRCALNAREPASLCAIGLSPFREGGHLVKARVSLGSIQDASAPTQTQQRTRAHSHPSLLFAPILILRALSAAQFLLPTAPSPPRP